MTRDPQVPVFRVGGVPVAEIDGPGLAASIARYLAGRDDRRGAFVAFCGAHGIVECQRNPLVRTAHEEAWLVVPDGKPLSWVGRLRGYRHVRQVPGIESIEAVCAAGIRSGWQHYFYGAGPDVAQRLGAEMSRRVPGLRVVGCETPPFRPLEPDEVAAMRARIVASGADVVWIGLSTPKQELFMLEHAHHWPGTIAMGVGAAFDVNVGRIARAPALLRAIGLEWAYRLAREPRRLWRRYALVVPWFLAIAAANLTGSRQASEKSDGAGRSRAPSG